MLEIYGCYAEQVQLLAKPMGLVPNGGFVMINDFRYSKDQEVASTHKLAKSS